MMMRIRGTLSLVVVIGTVAVTACRESRAQTAASTAASSASSTGLGTGMGMGMGGMGLLPMAYALNPSASLSPTDAAALGMQAQPNGGVAGQFNSLLANPMAAPMIYASNPGMSRNQMAMMMLGAQAQMTGLGSGQLSGVRPVGTGRTGSQASQPAIRRTRGTAAQPGGLAARYFNRGVTTARYPQSYYNRQTRYFPQVAR